MLVQAIQYKSGRSESVEDFLTEEEILQVTINGNPYTTTMRTPGNEEELVRGILLTEDVYGGVVNPLFEIVERNKDGRITKVNVVIAEELLGDGIQTKRNLMSVTSCGVCGKYEMDLELKGKPLSASFVPSPDAILQMFTVMSGHQINFQQTGGCHASSCFNMLNELLCVYEDIGRHNAVDKVIGCLMMKNLLNFTDATTKQGQAHCLLVSGRVSYEIVSKCYRARIPILAAVSAPSSMAVNYCKEKGIVLFAFCRDKKITRYA